MKYKKKVLKNGLRVFFVPDEQSLATTIIVLVEAGSKYETKDINGISHFLEHMCFKGTEKRPTQMAITSEFEGMGASYNAFTSQEYTGYYAKIKNEDVKHGLDVLSDMYLNPTLNEKELEKERGVIIEEIRMYEDLPMRRVQDMLMQKMYGDQPAGWDIAGPVETVRKISQKDMVAYRKKHYLPQSTVVVVSGGYKNETEVLKQIQKDFSGMRDGKKYKKIKVQESQKKYEESWYEKKVDQTHFAMGIRTFPLKDKRRHALEVLAGILGAGMSSRLFQKVRTELGAAYYIHASTDLFTDHGLLNISGGVEHGKLEEAIRRTWEECLDIVKNGVTEEELQRTKNFLTGQMVLGLETSEEKGFFFGMREILGLETEDPKVGKKALESVTRKEVQNIAKLIFKPEKTTLAVITPEKKDFRHLIV
jgi:predicted Zn-dependent peptidase